VHAAGHVGHDVVPLGNALFVGKKDSFFHGVFLIFSEYSENNGGLMAGPVFLGNCTYLPMNSVFLKPFFAMVCHCFSVPQAFFVRPAQPLPLEKGEIV
jgi:hypothetical protein